MVEAKAGAGSATLSMAKAGAFFADAIIRAAFKGEKNAVECRKQKGAWNRVCLGPGMGR